MLSFVPTRGESIMRTGEGGSGRGIRRRHFCFSSSSSSSSRKSTPTTTRTLFKIIKEKRTTTTTAMKGGGIFLDDSGRGKCIANNKSGNSSSSSSRDALLGEFDGGGGNVFGGSSGGSGWNNNNNNNNENENEDERHSSSMATRFLLYAIATSALTVVPLANAKGSTNAAANRMKAQTEKAFQSLPSKAKDFFVSMLYGFVIFFGVKMALKSFFAPVALFSFTMFVLHKMKVLSFGPMDMYESWVRPHLPREFQKDSFAFLRGADTMSEKYTKAFWSAAHRILPACNSSHGEKALILGMLVAGLV